MWIQSRIPLLSYYPNYKKALLALLGPVGGRAVAGLQGALGGEAGVRRPVGKPGLGIVGTWCQLTGACINDTCCSSTGWTGGQRTTAQEPEGANCGTWDNWVVLWWIKTPFCCSLLPSPCVATREPYKAILYIFTFICNHVFSTCTANFLYSCNHSSNFPFI